MGPGRLVTAARAAALAVALVAGGPALADPQGGKGVCAAVRPHRWSAPSGATDRRGDLRVVGLQYKQDVANVTSYASFRTAMRCLVTDLVLPVERPGIPTLAVFNEDIGLMTLATGSRGASVRAQAMSPGRAPAGDRQPVATASALAQLDAAYAPQEAAYQALMGPVDPRKQLFLAATDTFARGFSRTFSEIANDFGIYVVASNNQATYRETHDPAEVALFGDPEVRDGTAFVATSPRVPNVTFLWGPHDLHPGAPTGEKNLLFRNEKVPLTSLESTLLALDPGPSSGPAAISNARGVLVAGHRVGFATSLPAFAWGYPFGRRPAGFAPCRDLSVSYAACMDSLGVDVMVQAEANPGRWAGTGSAGQWQPAEWLGSAWRAVADPTLHIRYAVNPMMVGNLLDLPFDGQSAILRRGGTRAQAGVSGRNYIGNLVPDGPGSGPQTQFLSLAPWTVPDTSRADLLAEGARLAPGSGSPRENDYLETAVYADLLPPAGPARRNRP